MEKTTQVINLVDECIAKLTLHTSIAKISDSGQEILDLYTEAVLVMNNIKAIASDANVAFNYINHFNIHTTKLSNLLPYNNQTAPKTITSPDKNTIQNKIKLSEENIRLTLNEAIFSIEFFTKLGFFRKNIVAIGANGSGKTSLSNELKKHLTKNGITISAQKILIIPTFEGISNSQLTSQKLKNTQTIDKTNKITYSTNNSSGAYTALNQMGSEFHVLLDNLLAERSAARNKYCDDKIKNKEYSEVPETKLDKALEIWNSLLTHRKISCVDGINIELKSSAGKEYPAHQMSDGEKTLLFLVAQVLQAPKDGFIVVDEPEMYLHKTITGRLWDKLEAERADCIFIYLTHDLDFATSRNAKKIWIRSFEFPSTWKIEEIPDNNIPEQLLLELLGSRKDILFCEGKANSLDAQIFNLLFDKYTICPVDSCFDVIYYTKTFNKINGINTKAFGIIDSDHHSSDRLASLAQENIYSYKMSEIENLLLDEEFLAAISRRLLSINNPVDSIKREVIEHLHKNIESQVAEYISAKINYYFRDSHVSSGKNTTDIADNLKKFIDGVEINKWSEIRKAEIEDIVKREDYARTLQIFNNKGLKSIVQKHLRTSDFTGQSLRLLNENNDVRNILRKNFPPALQP